MRRIIPALSILLTSAALIGWMTGCKNKADRSASKVDLAAQLEILRGADKQARLSALVEVGSMKTAAAPAVPELINCLNDQDPEIRRLAAYVLMEIGTPARSAKLQVEALLQDPDRSVAMQAAITLRTIDPNPSRDKELQKTIRE